jgi:excisionase family DNA binding protein
MQIDRTRMYRVKAVADMADVSVSTVYRAIESGSLDALRIGTAVRVPGPALATWIKKCEEAGHAACDHGTTASTSADTTAVQR